MTNLYLASRSPRRSELLHFMGLRFSLVDGEVDESARSAETAPNYVTRLALAKADAGARGLGTQATVLGADTIVVLDEQLLGKPRDLDEAAAMLARLAGRDHQVMTAVALVRGSQRECALSMSTVSFRDLSAAAIAAYCDSREPLGKAGAYAIQGQGMRFVERLQENYSDVMGLPIAETRRLLASVNWDWDDSR